MEATKQLKTCRLCATNGPNFRAIFNGQNEKNEIGEKISKCLPILISSDDELPGHICPMCLRSLNTSYKLLMKVIETDGKLRQLLLQSRVKKNQQNCSSKSHNTICEAEKNEPGTCGYYEINFVDAGAFDSHMETSHNSFETSAELLQHKHRTHYDNIDNASGEDCHDSAVIVIKDEGILVSEDSNVEPPAPKKPIKERFSERMNKKIEEEIVSVDGATSNKLLPNAKALKLQVEKKFACKQCPRKFLRIRHYEDHQNTHSRKEPYCCVNCPKRFRTYAARWIHEQSHKEDNEYICDLCQRSYKHKRFLKRHMLNHLPPEDWDFECEVCKFKFKRSTYLKQHMRVHSSNHPHKCDICGAAYGRGCDMSRHRKRHLVAKVDEKKKQTLHPSGGNDQRIQKLRSDNASKDIAKSKPVVCGLCGMSFTDADAFSSHMEAIHQSKWVCNDCESSFATSVELQQHKCKTHPDDINNTDGNDCQDFGAIKLKKERTSVSEDCDESAPVIDQQFSQEVGDRQLLEHQDPEAIEVKQERKSVSEDCEEPASVAEQQPTRTLRKRQPVETYQAVISQSSEGLYSCETCHKKFKTRAARSGHQRIHIRVHHHYYTCDYCQKKFTRRCSLVRHIMGHLGPPDGLFTCKVCKSSFKGASQLTNHMKIHTEKRIHECDVCSIKFRRKHDMLRHRSCHRDKEINRKKLQQLPQSNEDADQKYEQRAQDSSDEIEKNEPSMCGLSEISFVDVSTFASPMETFHQSKWLCNHCQNSFATSEELLQHKCKTHHDNTDDADGEDYKDFVALDMTEDEILESQHSNTEAPAPEEKTPERAPEKSEETIEEKQGISSVDCHICCFSIDKAFMSEHKKIHESFQVLCISCHTTFPTAYDFIKHNRKVHHRFKNTCIRFFCRNCNRSLSTPEALQEHWKVCEQRQPCKYCNKIFNASELLQHVIREHRDKIPDNEEVVKLECPQCKVVFTDKKLFMNHTHEPSEDFHLKISTYKCDLCPKTLCSLPSLRLHKKWHRDRKCPECNWEFETSRAFSRHLQQVHNIRMSTNETAPQQQPRELRKRRIMHPQQDLYACGSCDKKFKTCAARLSHQRVHGIATLYTDYTCDHCQRKFRYKSTLLRHIRCHMPRETWQFECRVCTRKFSRGSNLKNHMRLHSNGDAHDCDICGARYRRKYDMLQHRNCHEVVMIKKKKQQLSKSRVDENQQDCEPASDASIDVEKIQPLCEISFVDTGAFASSMETPHQSKWDCDLCQDSFATSDELLQHKEKTHHDNTDNSGAIEIKEEIISESQESHVEPSDPKKILRSTNSEKIVHKNRRSMLNNGCLICHASIDEAFMPEHQKMHELFEVYCDTCQSQFPTAHDLIRHKRDTHNMFTKTVVRFFCRNCNRALANVKSLEAHVNFCKLRNKCNYCDKAFNWPDLLHLHLKREHGNRMKEMDKLQCPQCNKVFTDKKLFMSHSHESSVRKEEKYECVQCNKFFLTSARLETHCEDIHLKPSKYQCKVCQDTFFNRSTLQKHEKRHLNRTCSKCDQVFDNYYALSAHLKEVHKITFAEKHNEKEFNCQYCPQRFRKRYRLKQHLNIHTRKHLYSCTICDRKFNIRRSLLRHFQVHLPRENWIFECDLCKLKFKSREHLKKHMGIHSRNYAYKCDICGAAYLRECNLVRHKLCHSETAETDDGQQQQSSSSLNDNEQQNTEVRSDNSSGEIIETEPVICGFCEISFVDVSAFDSHMERLHQSKWVCNLCQNSFATSDELLQHKHKTHYDNVDEAVQEFSDSTAIEVKEETILLPEQSDTQSPAPKKAKRKNPEKMTLPQSEWFCDQCKKSFSASEQLLQHIVEVHCSNIDNPEGEDCNDSKAIEIKEEIILVSEHSDTESISVEESRRDISTSKQIEEEIEGEAVIIDCTICKVPVEKVFMSEHLKIHEPFELFCTKCHCKFSNAYDLIKHKREAHFLFNGTVIRFYCRNCNRSMSDSESLKLHKKCVKAQYNCKYCDEKFNWLQQLRLHLHHEHHERMLKDKEVKIFECNRCGKVYTDRRRFRLHTAVHRARDKGRYRCKQCNVYYSKAMDLDDHRQTVHKNIRS